MVDRVKMPDFEEVKNILEGRFKIRLFGRKINGINYLTQWSPLYIEVTWAEDVPIGHEGYWLTIAQNDHSIPVYSSGYQAKDTIESIIGKLDGFCKKRTFVQQSLW